MLSIPMSKKYIVFFSDAWHLKLRFSLENDSNGGLIYQENRYIKSEATDSPENEIPNQSIEEVIKSIRLQNKKQNKILREVVEPYLGFDSRRGYKIRQNKPRGGRSLGPRCMSTYCKVSTVRHYDDISEDTRKVIFESFWKKMDWSQRKEYVRRNVSYSCTKRPAKTGLSRRIGTFDYFLPVEEAIKKRVSQTTFLNTIQ